jgi:hypothetical protein
VDPLEHPSSGFGEPGIDRQLGNIQRNHPMHAPCQLARPMPGRLAGECERNDVNKIFHFGRNASHFAFGH